MWAGFPHTDVLLAHAALLRRSSSLCCPHSRHLHSSHSCLQSFKSSPAISTSARLYLSLSLAAKTSIALLPRDEKEQEWGRRIERKKGALPEEDERGERSEGRTGQQGSDEVCLGYVLFCFVFFLQPLCGASILSLVLSSKENGGFCRC